jgi:hypothetical protein
VGRADRVVDSSTDEPLAIAGRFPNVRIIHRPFDSHAEQWRFAATETGITTDWILRLDADYMLERALCEEIAALVPAPETAAYQIGFTYCIAAGRCAPRSIPRCRSCSAAARGPSLPTAILKNLERWLQSQSRYEAIEAEQLLARRWSELSWADRLRCTRVLGPLAVAAHCLLVKGLMFDGTAGLHYTAQRVTADLILSMHLRLQTVTWAGNSRYARLIEAFRGITGVPIVLNTSFNENEPVVCKPEEAIDCFLRTKMDVLVLGDTFIER